MLQLKNHTPFAAQMAILPDPQGLDTLYLLVKGSFNLGEATSLCDEQSPVCMADVYWGEPGLSSLKYPGDLHPGKPASDIIMLGHACSPEKRLVYSLDVSLQVASLQKTLRVFGPRVWQRGLPSHPEAFSTLPLVYENAYGGQHIKDGECLEGDSRNPLGKGFLGKQSPNLFEGQPLPAIEDPRQLLRQLGDSSSPAGFGAIAPHWQPRAALAGTYDSHWQETRAPYLPEDYSPRFMNAAHPDLIYPGYLQGGEPVTITGMHPIGPLQCQVPRVQLVAQVHMGGQTHSPGFVLETLLLEPNQLRMSLIWKAALVCDKQALKIQQVSLSLARA
jgi:hypothetical protein